MCYYMQSKLSMLWISLLFFFVPPKNLILPAELASYGNIGVQLRAPMKLLGQSQHNSIEVLKGLLSWSTLVSRTAGVILFFFSLGIELWEKKKVIGIYSVESFKNESIVDYHFLCLNSFWKIVFGVIPFW